MPDTKKPVGDYEVGYGKPPKANQFKKGQSGNAKGRPKKKRCGEIDAGRILDEPVSVRVGDQAQEMQPFEAAVRKLVRRGLAGDLKAIIRFVKLCEEYQLITVPTPEQGGGVIVAPKGFTPEEWLNSVTEMVPDDAHPGGWEDS